MTKSIRLTGFNGARLLKLRRSQRWSQSELADKLGVHRATLIRWESNLVDPPLPMADKLQELFGVPRDWFYKESDAEEEPANKITDPWLKSVPLFQLQKWTAPALQLLRKSASSLAIRVDLPVQRIQEILDGNRPSAMEIQMFRDALGPDFNPTPTLMKRVTPRPDNASQKMDILLARLEQLERTQAQILRKLDQLLSPQLAQRRSAEGESRGLRGLQGDADKAPGAVQVN